MKLEKLVTGMMMFIFLMSLFHNASAETAADNEIKSITFSMPRGNGWRLAFRSDGSAEVSYGSSGGDSWETAPDIFDLELIASEIRPLLEEGFSSSEPAVSVSIKKDLRTPGVGKEMGNSKVVQDLFRKALENLSGIVLEERFREILQKSPPFEIQGLEIREDQTKLRPIKSLTSHREDIYPRELTGEEDLSQFYIDKKSKAYVESLRKKRSVKDSSAKEEDGNERRAKEASVPGGDVRATPWWAVIAGAVAAVIGLGWVLLRRKSSNRA